MRQQLRVERDAELRRQPRGDGLQDGRVDAAGREVGERLRDDLLHLLERQRRHNLFFLSFGRVDLFF